MSLCDGVLNAAEGLLKEIVEEPLSLDFCCFAEPLSDGADETRARIYVRQQVLCGCENCLGIPRNRPDNCVGEHRLVVSSGGTE